MPLQHPRRKARQSCSEQGSLTESISNVHPEYGCFLEGALGLCAPPAMRRSLWAPSKLERIISFADTAGDDA